MTKQQIKSTNSIMQSSFDQLSYQKILDKRIIEQNNTYNSSFILEIQDYDERD